MKRVIFIILIVLGCFVAIRGILGSKKEVTVMEKDLNVVPVAVEKAVKRSLGLKIHLVGDLKSIQEVNVYPKIPGKVIQRIYVEKGDWVKEGQLLASLEKDAILAQIRQTEALHKAALSKIKEVEANLRLVKADRERFERLYKEGAVPKQRLEYIQTQDLALEETLSAAKDQAESLKASLEVLNVTLNDHDIKAPMEGYISNRYVDEGTLSDTKVPIIRISQDRVLKVISYVTEKDFPGIRKGMDVDITVDAYPDKVFKGKIEVINPTIDPLTRSGLVEIWVENEDLILRSGMFAKIVVNAGRKEALSVPKEALNRIPGTNTYFVFVSDGKNAVLRNVKVGLEEEQWVEVIEGVREGEPVVIKGQNRLKDGAQIKVVGKEEL